MDDSTRRITLVVAAAGVVWYALLSRSFFRGGLLVGLLAALWLLFRLVTAVERIADDLAAVDGSPTGSRAGPERGGSTATTGPTDGDGNRGAVEERSAEELFE